MARIREIRFHRNRNKETDEEHGERDLNENFSTTWNTLNEQIRR